MLMEREKPLNWAKASFREDVPVQLGIRRNAKFREGDLPGLCHSPFSLQLVTEMKSPKQE
jgi:hypothetical protein